MKCPKCGFNKKRSEGMVCDSCRYQFALDPKEEPYLSDMAFKKVLDRVSTYGKNHFTYNQIYAQLYRLLRKKKTKARIFTVFGAGAITLFISLPLGGDMWWVTRLILCAVVMGIVGLFFWKWKPRIKEGSIRKVIQKYDSRHGIDNMVKGASFTNMEPREFDREILKYAPERMLIVERDDMADMLLLNDFAMDNKTLVVSANRYPKRAFKVFKHFAQKNPDIPISLIHDVSRVGVKLKEKLKNDPEWGLANREIKDLGLFPENLKQLKEPIWRPEPSRGAFKERAVPGGDDPIKNMNKGFRAPVDVAPPHSFMSTAAMAMIVGAALLSPELMAQQAQDSTSGSSGGGFG
jgi:hypothetical protein